MPRGLPVASEERGWGHDCQHATAHAVVRRSFRCPLPTASRRSFIAASLGQAEPLAVQTQKRRLSRERRAVNFATSSGSRARQLARGRASTAPSAKVCSTCRAGRCRAFQHLDSAHRHAALRESSRVQPLQQVIDAAAAAPTACRSERHAGPAPPTHPARSTASSRFSRAGRSPPGRGRRLAGRSFFGSDAATGRSVLSRGSRPAYCWPGAPS